MKSLPKNKKVVFFIILIILLIIAGVFLWQKYKKPDVGYVLSEEFTITESNGEKIIEYKEGGFKMRIPGDWDTHDSSGVRLLFTSPDFRLYSEVGPYDPAIAEDGCAIEMSIKKEIESSDYDIEYSYIKLCLESSDNCGDEMIEINGNKALKHIYSSESHSVYKGYIQIKVPKNEKIYNFATYFLSSNKKQCIQEFDKFLETVEIKK